MTAERDVEHVLERWLVDGVDEMPDRVYHSILDRVERQPQQRAWRVSWRDSTVNAYLKPILAVAAVVVLAIGGIVFIVRPSGSQVGGVAVPSPSPATPTSAPTPTAPPPPSALDVHAGTLVAGRYRFRPFDAAPAMTLEADVPGGWQGFPKWALIGPKGTGGPNGVGTAFLSPAGLFSDPCHWDVAGDGRWPQRGDVSTGATVDEFVAALQASRHYVAGPATDTTVGGYAGKQLVVELPSDVDFATACDKATGETNGTYFLWGSAEADGSNLYAQGPGSRWHLSVADVNGTRIVVLYDDYPGTSAADRAAAQAILDSLVITP